MRKLQAIAAACLLISVNASAPSSEQRLAKVQRFTRSHAVEAIWPGLGEAPFDALLIAEERETLLCREKVPDGFAADGNDAVTGCTRATRARSQLPAMLLSAMPLFGPPATIVIGSPSVTGLDDATWTSTVLHEHFHQYEWSLPDHYRRVAALDLAGGDNTGMWMLNYPFPYQDPAAGAAYASASSALATALDARDRTGFVEALRAYLSARARFQRQVGERNWRYLDFQLWQEGVARWTEIALDRLYPDPQVVAHSALLEARLIAVLRKPNLATQAREVAYPLGAGEALLLNVCSPDWRKRYIEVLGLTELWKEARCLRR